MCVPLRLPLLRLMIMPLMTLRKRLYTTANLARPIFRLIGQETS